MRACFIYSISTQFGFAKAVDMLSICKFKSTPMSDERKTNHELISGQSSEEKYHKVTTGCSFLEFNHGLFGKETFQPSPFFQKNNNYYSILHGKSYRTKISSREFTQQVV